MKKIVFILFLIVLVILFTKEDEYIIPSDAIRFRIIANSNSIEDQALKKSIKRALEEELGNYLRNIDNYDDANLLIINNLDKIEKIVTKKTMEYNINYGLNYFPEKQFKNVKYPAGEYNSLVITIGQGLGDNWWCVLYPPLCFIDEDDFSDTEYSFFIKDIFNRIK